ncbi:MAG: sugar phosphate isomerase/epimerase, partial [Chloroflexia bacterium]
KLSGRIPLVHVKDMEAGHERRDAPVGEGIIPWQEILPACAAAGTEWYVVEQHHPRDPMRDVEVSLNNLIHLLEKA